MAADPGRGDERLSSGLPRPAWARCAWRTVGCQRHTRRRGAGSGRCDRDVPGRPSAPDGRREHRGRGRSMAREDEFDIVVIGGGPGGYATALYGAAAGLSVAIVERDKVGGTCLHRGCIPAKEFLETAAVLPHRRGSKEFGIDVSERHRRLLGQPGPQERRGRQALQGPGRPAQGPQGHHPLGTGTLQGGPPGRGRRRRGRRQGRRRPQRRPGGRLGAADAARVRGRRALGHDLRRVPRPQGAPGVGRGHRRRRRRLRVRLAAGRPRLQGHRSSRRSTPSSPGCDDDIVRLVARSFKKRGIDIVTGVQVEGHTPSSDGR